MEQILNEITQIVTWYKSDVSVDYNDLDTLIHKKKQLACAANELSMALTPIKEAADKAYVDRKIAHAEAKMSYLDPADKKDKKTAAFAESQASIDTKDLHYKEKQLESAYTSGKTILLQANNILSTMMQHFAHLRKEKDNQQFLSRTN